MSLREQLNQHSSLSTAILLVVFAFAVGFIVWWNRPQEAPEPQTMAYFYDLNTNELFVLPADTAGPAETESGPYNGMPAGVRAHVYCCGPLVKDAETFVGYLEVPTEAVPEDQRPPGLELSEESEDDDLLIRRPDGDAWHLISSPEGRKIMNDVRARCGEDENLTYVRPPPQ